MWAGLGSTVLQRYSLGPAICHCRDKEPEAQAPVTDTRVLPVDGNQESGGQSSSLRTVPRQPSAAGGLGSEKRCHSPLSAAQSPVGGREEKAASRPKGQQAEVTQAVSTEISEIFGWVTLGTGTSCGFEKCKRLIICRDR